MIILTGFLASLIAGLATAVGALPLLWGAKPSERQENALLGFAAGVMLAASFFSLIIPGIAHAEESGLSKVWAAAIVIGAMLIGALFIGQMNRIAPSLDRMGLGPVEGVDARHNRRIWLFVAAITLHNFPEGLAVGVSYGTGDLTAGFATAMGIGLQNIPEGLAVGVSLLSIGLTRQMAVLGALASGLVEPVAGFIGVATVAAMSGLLPWALGFAAGAMIYVVAAEIIPHTHRTEPKSGDATVGLMIGLAVMMFLDVVLG